MEDVLITFRDGILQVIDWLHINPRGIVTAAAGAILSLFFWNGNGFSAARTAGLFVFAICCGGYTIGLINSYVSSQDAAYLLNVGAGFLASDLLSTAKSQAPTLSRVIFDWAVRWLRKLTEKSAD